MDSTEKTIREWLETLPEPYRRYAIAELNRQDCANCDSGAIEMPSLPKAIQFAFEWHKAKRGGDFWYLIYERALAGEFDAAVKQVQEPDVTIQFIDSFRRILDKCEAQYKAGEVELRMELSEKARTFIFKVQRVKAKKN